MMDHTIAHRGFVNVSRLRIRDEERRIRPMLILAGSQILVKGKYIPLEVPLILHHIISRPLPSSKPIPRMKQTLGRNHLFKNISIHFHVDEFDIPIFKKIYDLYKEIAALRKTVSKQDRYTLWQRVESVALDLVENILEASALFKHEKGPLLTRASTKLNLLRFLIRLASDIKAIDGKKYTMLQQHIDEVGRMLGGWIKSIKADHTQSAS